MIIEEKDKRLVATILSSSNSVPVISGTMYAVVTLESDDADNLKFWDENDDTWQAAPVTWPTGSHMKEILQQRQVYSDLHPKLSCSLAQ